MLVMSALLCLIYSIAMPDGGSRMRIIASVLLACGQCVWRGIVSGSVCARTERQHKSLIEWLHRAGMFESRHAADARKTYT
ncbi:hypothetical protein SAMN05192544_10975 [Paraburkholderia hospita]|jgi:hypothetical protein|uniref:Uncharacterized protein n=1 Tax=Paraburkholderia hospita TaxID=169430 RepID=A0AAN1J783_9BURK|nr:hypothetical protein C2L64_09855 [Paraburkholderia hospita]SEI27770.1 hypothetical protein SAMN05192544_10975 [Paraburkholderia hospita]